MKAVREKVVLTDDRRLKGAKRMAPNCCFFVGSALLSLGLGLFAGPGEGSIKAVLKSVRAMNYLSLPSDFGPHHRTKWSNDWLILIDDDPGAPSFWEFDRSGNPVFNSLILIPSANHTRFDDFAAGPDGTIWAAGHATSGEGQQSSFLARITDNGQSVQIIRTTPYRPCQLSVAPDGTVWTVGFEVKLNADGLRKVDPSRDALRHFDASGRPIASALPVSSISPLRAHTGYLVANQDRIGWYAPPAFNGAAVYVEFSPVSMQILGSYPPVPAEPGSRYLVESFTLTPSGQAFAVLTYPVGGQQGYPNVLYKLDRNSKTWVAVAVPRDKDGYIPMMQGNDGESLIFTGTPDVSKVQVFDISQQ